MTRLSTAVPPSGPPKAEAAPDDGALRLMERYIEELRLTRNLSPYTLRNYRADILAFLRWLAAAGRAPLAVERSDLRRHLAERGEAGTARASLTRKVSTIHTFYRYLEREGHLSRDPLYGMSGPRRGRRLPKVLESAEMGRLLAAPPDDTAQGRRDRAILEMLYAAGLRVSELVGLDLHDLDLEHRIVVVRGKGNRQRAVLIGRPARDAVRRYIGEARPELAGRWGSGPHHDAVFLNRSGGRLTARSVQSLVRKWATACGLAAGAHPHLLRHTFATHMLDNGAELRVVQELLGHQSANTTQIYLEVTSERQRVAYERAFFNQLRRKGDDD